MSLADEIRAKLEADAQLKPAHLIVRESGGSSCSGSFTVVVVSTFFDGQPPLQRQRYVNGTWSWNGGGGG